MKRLISASRLFICWKLSTRLVPVFEDFVKESQSQAFRIFSHAQTSITNRVRQPWVEGGMPETVHHMI